MLKFTLIFLGSGAGGVCRYLFGKLVQRSSDTTFPVGTLVVNLFGCLLIGFLTSALAGRIEREEIRLAITVGFLGGFTTFSAFGMEIFWMLQNGFYARAGVYATASVFMSLFCIWIGFRTGQSTVLSS